MGHDLETAATAAWKQRFRVPSLRDTQVAAAHPTRGLVISNRSGVNQLYAWDVPTGAWRQLTNDPGGVWHAVLSADGRFIYYMDDPDGDQVGQFVRLPYEGGPPELLTPDLPPYSALPRLSLSGNLFGFIAADARGFHLYALPLGPGQAVGVPREIVHRATMGRGLALSHSGELAVVPAHDRAATSEPIALLAVEVSTGALVGELWEEAETGVAMGQFAPQPGDLRLLTTTGRSGVNRPLIWDVRTGEQRVLALDDLDGDVVPWDWSPDGQHILLCQTYQAVNHLAVYDVATGHLTHLEQPPGVAWTGYFGTRDEVFAHWEGEQPTALLAFDVSTGARTRTVLAPAPAPPGYPAQSVTFPSSDGQTIQGWLMVPTGAGPFPTILHMHGGPNTVQMPGYAADLAAWADHGFAVLSVNYRGSTTFGSAFRDQIKGQPGQWEVEDMVAARAWLIAAEIARPDTIVLTGFSYGGYLTLLALGTRPTLWAGGIASSAIADWASMYEDTFDWLRTVIAGDFGGTPYEKPEQYAASSPLTYVEHVTAPVFILHGRNDVGCPPRPVERYAAQITALGKPIEIVWLDDGHGISRVEDEIALQERMVRFALRLVRP
jgi:dienelactone hydrolase